jgi:hypothetical protein
VEYTILIVQPIVQTLRQIRYRSIITVEGEGVTFTIASNAGLRVDRKREGESGQRRSAGLHAKLCRRKKGDGGCAGTVTTSAGSGKTIGSEVCIVETRSESDGSEWRRGMASGKAGRGNIRIGGPDGEAGRGQQSARKESGRVEGIPNGPLIITD